MILAGIDEAGYGPLLGPLVVGCCAFEVKAERSIPPVCLWKRLGRVVSKSRPRGGKKIHINDSKAVYSPSGGIRELERALLAMVTAWDEWPGDLDGLLGAVAGEGLSDLLACRWYGRGNDEKFPLDQDAMTVRIFANALRMEMQASGTTCVHLAARVLGERELNKHLNNTRNKSNTLFSLAAIHLDYLLRTYGQKDLVIYCDRQGGREHYGHLLRLMFEEWRLEVVKEEEGYSEYRLVRGGDAVPIVFCEKAEGQCMPVAVASMLSKYLREALMGRFNAFWRGHLPELKPTAGYYTDGLRFLADIRGKREELGIGEEEMVRSR